jgi:hypothetical protein
MRLHTEKRALIEPSIKLLVDGIKKRNPIAQYQYLRFRAEVDWIEIKICTQKPSNFHTVRTRLEASYVKPLDAGGGGAASEFRIKFYSLKNWQEIDRALANFTHDHPLSRPVEVTGIEIAFDAYSKVNDRQVLAAMTTKFYRGLTYPVSENQRITPGTKGSVTGIPSPKMLVRRVERGENIYIGDRDEPTENMDDPHSWMKQHFYLKETDTNAPLPIEQHRARVEITLRGLALPHQLLEEWRSHNFTVESQFFKFRKPGRALSWHQQTYMGQVSQYGGKQKKRSGVRRTIYSAATVADIPLNNKAYDALKNLNKRMKGGVSFKIDLSVKKFA